jgi:DNA-binding CsgD family transcriptional regulator
VPAYLGGPTWPELDALLATGDLPGAAQLAELDASIDPAERQLVIGVCCSMTGRGEQAVAALSDSLRAFAPAQPARSAVAAVFLGRLHFFGFDSPMIAAAWFARARRLVADRPDCLEAALTLLPLPGCDIPDVARLHADAQRALAIARTVGEPNIEAKALADLGTAQVSRALVDEGLQLLDEAMTMVLSGEASSPIAAVEVICNLLSACARVGDLDRADQWTRAADRHLGLAADRGPAFLYAHCRSHLGLILCDVGRWDEAEVALRLGGGRAQFGGARVTGQSKAALAELWIAQGRLADARRLIADRADHPDSVLPLAALQLADRRYADAIAVAGRGVATMGDDRMRVARLLLIRVQAGLAGDDLDAARAAARDLDRLAGEKAPPVLRARAALGRGLVARAAGDGPAADAAFAGGLAALAGQQWPLLRADLHLARARLLAGVDDAAAADDARSAHLIYDRLGAPAAVESAALLTDLGRPTRPRARPPDATTALSDRERAVLDLLRDGRSNAEIAARQHNSVRTIEHHVSSILSKLGLRSRAEAAAYAVSMEVSR